MRTPLYHEHETAGARRMPFAGWEMPVQYEGILAEHGWTRTRASVFDICHMGEFELAGPSAGADLERLLTLSVATMKDGQCRYGYLLNEAGGVLDDLTCYRFAPDRFWLIVNAGTRAGDAAWIQGRLSKGTVFADRSDELAKLDVQGPASRQALEQALGAPLPELGYFRFAEWAWEGIPFVISRTGYTGEWGYELYFPAGEAVRVWRKLLAGGAIKPAGLGARDTLRLEVGYPLYGHELHERLTPVSATRGRFLDTTKAFIGREAVLRELETGTPRVLVGLLLDSRRAARAGDSIWAGDHEAGEVTSGSFAPSLDTAVAMAYVDTALAAPGTALDLLVHGKRLAARVVPLPFYTRGTARRKEA